MPAVIVLSAGVDATEKSAKNIDNARVVLCEPLVPLTVKFVGLGLVPES